MQRNECFIGEDDIYFAVACARFELHVWMLVTIDRYKNFDAVVIVRRDFTLAANSIQSQ